MGVTHDTLPYIQIYKDNFYKYLHTKIFTHIYINKLNKSPIKYCILPQVLSESFNYFVA